MKARRRLRLILALALCVTGFALARATPYREATVVVDAGGCRLVTNIIDKGSDDTSGSVILFHGIAANKKIMGYVARSFAKLNLRVFVPDLPGHGRTQGPFSFSRAESCADSFTRQLISHGAIDPARTILAGHSMGGAIADRLAAHIPFAGVVAISPAPMSTRHSIAAYLLPFENAPPASAKTLVISGSWEPRNIRDSARELLDSSAGTAAGKYVLIPHATHVSLIFDPDAARAAQEWAIQVLGLPGGPSPPSLLPLTGSLAGFVGILLLAGPFIRETLSVSSIANVGSQAVAATSGREASPSIAGCGPATLSQVPDSSKPKIAVAPAIFRSAFATAIASLIAITILRYWKPLSFVHLFDGGYFASFLLVSGALLLATRFKTARSLWETRSSVVIAAGLAALLLHLLVSGWFDATLTESWLKSFRWARFPVLLLASLPYLAAEELWLPPSPASLRMATALASRFVAWLPILLAIFVLHAGPILLLLLAPYIALFCVLQRAGSDLVYQQTRSPAAAALFNAILLAGLCLVIFPVT